MNKIHIAVDAMGGDNAPGEIVKGVAEALAEHDELSVTLVGRQDDIEKALEGLTWPKDRLTIHHASEVIGMAEPPVRAVTTRKDSSIVQGMRLVKDGTCSAFISAGSTGAVLAGGQLIVGRLKGIERPPLAPVMPSAKGPVLLVDCGANVDARASHLVQFAQMGSIYMENIVGIKNPRVALYNVGEEEEKGNALVKEVYPLLKECETIRFVGNIEGRDIPAGAADVVVCDAFVGNAILKMYEGVASVLLKEIKSSLMSTLSGKIGGMLIRPSLKGVLKKYDTSAYGGAPLLGLKGLVVKVHGNAKAADLKKAVSQCILFEEQKINDQFKDRMQLIDRTKKSDAGDSSVSS